MKKIVKPIVIGLSIVALAACTSKYRPWSSSSPEGSNTDGQVGELTGQGLAGADGFGGDDFGGRSVQELLSVHIYHFAFDSATISAEDKPAVIAQAHYLANNPDRHILLAGNTDSRGSREYNIALGWRRAQSVEKMMLVNGANKDQIKMVSYGEEKPIAMGDTEVAYEQNRRVELSYES